MVEKVTGRFADPEVDQQFDRLLYILNQLIALSPELGFILAPSPVGRDLLATIDQRYLLSFGKYATANGYAFLPEENLAVDPSFSLTTAANDTTYWDFDGTTKVWDSTGGVNNSPCARFDGSGTLTSQHPVSAASNDYYYLTTKVKRSPDWRGTVKFYLVGLDATKAPIGYEIGSLELDATSVEESFHEFATFVQVSHASLSYVAVAIYVNRTSAAGSLYVDDVTLRLVPSTIDRVDSVLGETWDADLMAATLSPLPATALTREKQWSSDISFSSAAADAVSWSGGTIYRGDESFAVDPGSLTGMASGTTYYIYFDDASPGPPYSLSVTANPADVAGAGKILIATAKKNDKAGAAKALYFMFGADGQGSPWITGDNVAANSITANEILVNNLAAVSTQTGGLTVSNYIKSSNYVQDQDGFSINSDGSAEFNDIKARGTVVITGGNGFANLEDAPKHVFADGFGSNDVGINSITGWEVLLTGGYFEIKSSSEATFGGKILSVGNNSVSDELLIAANLLIPFDPDRVYRIRARYRKPSSIYGSGPLHIGWLGIAGDGTTVVDINGGTSSSSNQHYHCVSNENPPDTWTEKSGYTFGYGATNGTSAVGTPTSPGKMHPDVRYLRPLIHAHVGGTAGIIYIDYFVVEVLDTDFRALDNLLQIDGVVIKDGTVTANKIYTATLAAITVNTGGLTVSDYVQSSNFAEPTGSANGQGFKLDSTGALQAYGGSHVFGGPTFFNSGSFLVCIGLYLKTTSRTKQFPSKADFDLSGALYVFKWNTSTLEWELNCVLGATFDEVLRIECNDVYRMGINAYSQHDYGGRFESYGAHGLYAKSTLNSGISASGGDYGVICDGGLGNIHLIPDASLTTPTHVADKGALWVGSDARVWINTDGSTGWQLIGTQT